MDILALDFDGVICNSARETAASAWKAAFRLWPRLFAGDITHLMVEAFQKVRSVMEAGHESILLLRLLRDGYSVAEILGDFPSLRSPLIRELSITEDTLAKVFGQTRDTWIADDLPAWVEMHQFYDGIVDAVNQIDVPAYIITTKQKRFALSLCRAVDLRVPEENIYGLESGKKLAVLTKLSRRHHKARFHFVEDRLPTLLRMADGVSFDLHLYLAGWGYNTGHERKTAQKMDNIHLFSREQFLCFMQKLS